MKVLVCPDSFKDCAPAPRAAAALARGCRRAGATAVELPLADGGEGTVAAMVAATGGRFQTTRVTGPLGEPVEAVWGILGDPRTAVIEMAAASGLEQVPPERRDPSRTTTFGTGELVLAALDAGVEQILLGLGGSATNDGGAGLAQALGARFLDAAGAALPPGGLALSRLARIDADGLDPRLAEVAVRVACDVDNPLLGPRGASRVYGPQKGASPELVEQLDAALGTYAARLREDLGQDVAELPGAGAAGGLGAGLVAFCAAALVSGIELVLEAVRFDQAVRDADLILTGEGRLDASTLQGKTIQGVLRRAGDVPVIAIAGALSGEPAAFWEAGLLAAFALPSRPMMLTESLAEGEAAMERVAAEVVRAVSWSRSGGRFPP